MSADAALTGLDEAGLQVEEALLRPENARKQVDGLLAAHRALRIAEEFG